MNYKCKYCGWRKEQGSYSMDSTDLTEIFEHEKTHDKEREEDRKKNGIGNDR